MATAFHPFLQDCHWTFWHHRRKRFQRDIWGSALESHHNHGKMGWQLRRKSSYVLLRICLATRTGLREHFCQFNIVRKRCVKTLLRFKMVADGSSDITTLAPKYFNIRRGVTLAAIVGGWAMCPWIIVSSAETFLDFMSAYAIFMAPIAGMLTADYWLVKKRKYDVPALYNPRGIYFYKVCQKRAMPGTCQDENRTLIACTVWHQLESPGYHPCHHWSTASRSCK